MRIDRAKATLILEHAVARSVDDPGPADWIGRINNLEKKCGGKNLTFIAALGTAILAKATDQRADPFALKAGLDTPGAYSARSLCQHVLAAHSPRLEIDIGVSGREPLNNQPFYAENYIADSMQVMPSQREALRALLDALAAVSLLKDKDEAFDALRAYVTARKRTTQAPQMVADVGPRMTLHAFISEISAFVAAQSELGKRAQAVVAGLLDATYGSDRVAMGRIHDPDRNFPGDVALAGPADGSWIYSIEVRDKPVEDHDLYHLVRKALRSGVPKACCLCTRQNGLQAREEQTFQWAQERGVLLLIYGSWTDFIRDLCFWGGSSSPVLIRSSSEAIYQRLIEIEVSLDGLEEWRERFDRSIARRTDC